MTASPAEVGAIAFAKDPLWGECWTPGAPAYVTPLGITVWMYRKGQRVRFYDERATQVGPEHKNVVPAMYWAAANAWIDPVSPNLSLACIAEVRGQIAERVALGKASAYEKALAADVANGAWDPRQAAPESSPNATTLPPRSVATPPLGPLGTSPGEVGLAEVSAASSPVAESVVAEQVQP